MMVFSFCLLDFKYNRKRMFNFDTIPCYISLHNILFMIILCYLFFYTHSPLFFFYNHFFFNISQYNDFFTYTTIFNVLTIALSHNIYFFIIHYQCHHAVFYLGRTRSFLWHSLQCIRCLKITMMDSIIAVGLQKDTHTCTSNIISTNIIMVDEATKRTLAVIPLLRTRADPRDGDLWVTRLKEEYIIHRQSGIACHVTTKSIAY